jgi:hypothetical protein
VKRFEDQARLLGMSVIRLDFSEVTTRTELATHVAKAFMFPHEARGMDAALDLMSDLSWFGDRAGYLIVVQNLGQSSDVVEAFAGVLPNVVDRWRSQNQPFVVLFQGECDRLTSALAVANRKMDEAGKLPWAQPGTGAVSVCRHADGQSEPAE